MQQGIAGARADCHAMQGSLLILCAFLSRLGEQECVGLPTLPCFS